MNANHANTNHVTLRSPLSPSECATRLRGQVDRFQLFGSNPAIGWVSETSVRIRKRIKNTNGFQTILSATLKPAKDGTEIHGSFAMNPLAKVFMIFWFGGLIVGSIGMLIQTIAALIVSGEPSILFAAVFPPIFLLIGYSVMRYAIKLGRDDAQFLTDFLIWALDAKSLKDGPGERSPYECENGN